MRAIVAAAGAKRQQAAMSPAADRRRCQAQRAALRDV